MDAPLTLQALFDIHREKLALRWWAGRAAAGQNVIRSMPAAAARVDLVDYLSYIRPYSIQVLGRAELEHLGGMPSLDYVAELQRLSQQGTTMILLADNLTPPAALTAAAEVLPLVLLGSALPSDKLINHLRYYLTDLIAERCTVHGVYMEVMGIGVLITGESGVGKSEVALELLTRGHRLIADDAPEFTRIAPDTINGTCPEMLRDFLEVRGLGILNVRAMFGDNAVKKNKYLRLIIHLVPISAEDNRHMDRLWGDHDQRMILDVVVPRVTLPVAPGRNLAVLLEGAVRNHMLAVGGYNAADDFIAKQHGHLSRSLT